MRATDGPVVPEPLAPIGGWTTATVQELEHRPGGVRIRALVADRVDHFPGQHYVIRLTAPDGYTASRSYSVVSDPADPLVEFWVQGLPDGEVSGFLTEDLQVGDDLEVRGPIGGYFVWTGTAPALLVGGGSGLAPLVSMVRHARRIGRTDLLTVVAAARTRAELPYADELADNGAYLVLSREDRDGRPAGRLQGEELVPYVDPGRRVLVCGSAGFAEAASSLLVSLGQPAGKIRVERFGPSG